MTIYDDGNGIKLETLKFGRGFSYIQERVEAFEGSFKVKCVDDKNGCMLIVVI